MIATATDGAFYEFGVSVGYPSMVAVAREDLDTIKVGCSNFMMWLLDGAESFASLFHRVRG